MPEKDFEKQVREKMGELKLRPGESVWDKIEKTLRKDKRKKVFFILPLVAALLLLGYTGYRLIVHTDEKKNVQTIEQLSPENNGTEKEGNVSEKTVLKEAAAQKKQATKTSNAANTDEKINNPRPELADEPVVVYKRPHNAAVQSVKVDEPMVVDKRPDSAAGQSVKADEPVVVDKRPDSAAVQSVKADEPVVVDKRPDSATVQSVKADEPVVVDKRPDSAAVQSLIVTNPAPKKKLSAFAMQVAIGVSDIRSKPLSFSKTNPNSNYTAGPITGYPQWQQPFPPSEITAGKAFSIGLEWQKAFTKRSGFSTGLRYAYFSNKIMVGTKTNLPLQLSYDALADKTLDDYYGGTQAEKFTNRYHFLQLPLEYHFRFNNNKKIGFDWSTGLTLGWLVSSNELMYDTIRGGIYFHSTDLFNRTHLGFQAGISIRFKLKNQAAFLAGPQAYLDLSRMTKDGFDRNRYLFAGTLQARYVFPGKTKK